MFTSTFFYVILYFGGDILNNRLKEIRLEINQTQTEFGNLLGVSRDAIASYERGRVVPSDTFIQLLCTKLLINENWLRTGIGEKFEPKTRSEELALWAGKLAQKSDDNFAKRFALMLSQLDETEWKFIEMKLFSLFEDHKNNKD